MWALKIIQWWCGGERPLDEFHESQDDSLNGAEIAVG